MRAATDHKPLQIPCVFFFKLTIPLAGDHWCKYKAVLHSITAPITILFAFQLYDIQLFDGPSLWMLALGLSAILALLLVVFTDTKRPPRFYRKVTSYVGFVASTAWIYAIAAEVVDVVLMIGIISTISFDILGLTVIAWSNSLGDLIADLAVARQGFPRMAIAAAVAGPLFSPKETSDGKPVEMTPILRTMIIFLAVSISSSILILTVQRFHGRRFHSVILVALYCVFLVIVILNELKVIP
ncbi:Sodium/calcium exchanger protein [Aphelenchoides fujianensis]|nr:Sodium/calcium exchanger protein [Aphelenchoides fujianensis]